MSDELFPQTSLDYNKAVIELNSHMADLETMEAAGRINHLKVTKIKGESVLKIKASSIFSIFRPSQKSSVLRKIKHINKNIERNLKTLQDAVENDLVDTKEDVSKVINVVETILSKLNNVEKVESNNALYESYLDSIDTCYKIAEMIKEKKPEYFPGFSLKPTFIQRPDGTIKVIRQAPQIKTLVLGGGGAKGAGYGPSLVALEEKGELSGLEEVIGSSAGALAGMALASGFSANEVEDLSQNVKMHDIKYNCKKSSRKYPGFKRSSIGYAGTRAVEEVDQATAKSVLQYLLNNWDKEIFQEKLKELGEEKIDRLKKLKIQDFDIDRTAQMITFEDLHTLHFIEPAKFKDLTLTGWDNTNQKEVYFNYQNTPKLTIAYAARISISVPWFFSAVSIDPGDGKGMRKFTDGGIGSNMPTEAVLEHRNKPSLHPRQREKMNASTLLMPFDNFGSTYDVMHKPHRKRNIVQLVLEILKVAAYTLFGILFIGNPSCYKVFKKDKKKIYDAGPNAFVVAHGDIGMLDLKASKKTLDKAKRLSKKRALQQVELRRGLAIDEDFDNVEEVFLSLSDQEKNAIYQSFQSQSKTTSAVEAKEHLTELEQTLYNLVCKDF